MDNTNAGQTVTLPFYDDFFVPIVGEPGTKPRRISYVVHLRNGFLAFVASCSVLTYSKVHVGAVAVDRPAATSAAEPGAPPAAATRPSEEEADLLTESLLEEAPGNRMLSYLMTAPRATDIDDVDLEAPEA